MKVHFRLVDDLKKRLNFYQSFVIEICKVFVGEHTFLHKIDKIYVNIETRKVTVIIHGKQENVLSSNFNSERKEPIFFKRWLETFEISKTDFDSIRNIVNDKSSSRDKKPEVSRSLQLKSISNNE
jgi:hypothetical protein